MYLNQKIKKSVVIVIIMLVSVFSFTLMAKGNPECIAFSGNTVEQIYESIRNSDPLYEWEESIVTFQNKGMMVVCTLTIPNSGKKAPIIVTLNGFHGDRNDIPVPGTDEPCWKRFSRRLAEQGFASLRVDFRGSGDSDGDYSMHSFSTQISDAIAAINYIKKNLKHQVKTNSIGFFGFSQGGIVGSIVAARDRRVNSLVLWSTPTNPAHDYEGLLTKEGIQRGLAMEDGDIDTFGIYLNGTYYYSLELCKEFFENLFDLSPLAEIRQYRGPLMYIGGLHDIIVWPQPIVGETYLKYHHGVEKLVKLDTGHSFVLAGEETLDDAIFWSVAWFIKTLK